MGELTFATRDFKLQSFEDDISSTHNVVGSRDSD
jgi:hypothetical protein